MALMPTLYSHIFAVFFPYLHHMMLVDVKLDISLYKKITFHWFVNFEWHIAILVLYEGYEKLCCISRIHSFDSPDFLLSPHPEINYSS